MPSRISLVVNELARLHGGVGVAPADIAYRRGAINSVAVVRGASGLADTTEQRLFKRLNRPELMDQARDLSGFFRTTDNNFHRIRAAMLLGRLFDHYLPDQSGLLSVGTVPFEISKAIEQRNFRVIINWHEKNEILSSQYPEATLRAVGMAYFGIAYQLAKDLVLKSIAARTPQFRDFQELGRYRLRNPDFYAEHAEEINMPVRIELTSSVGSDIFFLAMDRPSKARCINISINMRSDNSVSSAPPIKVIVKPIKEEGIRITSLDLGRTKLVTDLNDLFDMQNDELSLLKAAIVASGIVPPALKNKESEVPLLTLLKTFMSQNVSYKGFEVVSSVTDIPRGSGLAVSTNLLAALIIGLLRFSGQSDPGIPTVSEKEKVEAASRCIYAEWVGGSGGGWQDYGGMWGGFKRILGQSADPILDPDSKGSLLPRYEPLNLEDSVIKRIIDSLVLVNGGTGVDVGPVLRLISEQYFLRAEPAWDARLRTEARFDEIYLALLKGDAEKLGELEAADFVDRTIISPLSNNAYHQLVYQRLKAIFRVDLWGYDSTGGRAGAGGIFFVNPKRKAEFEESFLGISEQAQHDLSGQMSFPSGPRVYCFTVNKEGAQVQVHNRVDVERIVGSWHKVVALPLSEDSGAQMVEDLKVRYGYDEATFRQLQRMYQARELSLKTNVRIESAEVQAVDPDEGGQVKLAPLIGSEEYAAQFMAGLALLRNPLAFVILNGGESSRFGGNVAKGFSPLFDLHGKYRSPIELKLGNAAYAREAYGSLILPIFLNGFFTHERTEKILQREGYFGFPPKDVYCCTHAVTHKLVPTVGDLDYWFEYLREGNISVLGEEAIRRKREALKGQSKEQGEGSIYLSQGVEKSVELASPGHLFSFLSIISNFTLGRLIERGVGRMMVSCNDNLLATIDPAILALHAQYDRGSTAEVVPRLFDRGGGPYRIHDMVAILEDFSFRERAIPLQNPYFNPITTWMEIRVLLSLVGITESEMVSASHSNQTEQTRINEAVAALAEKIPINVVLKYVQESLGDGTTQSVPVIQFEKSYGDLISLLDPTYLVVPKSQRHTQLKSVDHVFQIIADRSLEILEPQVRLR
ncbi:UTP--glucose-1-phosphate uridylyltransferase [Candidatus Saganbacteria bacterium]|nr:UTP--glucose-1-phosphate uridylyltransferase [Candidatus Saganbacteria bacterium]